MKAPIRIPRIEKSRIDNRYLVYTWFAETLCPWWGVPTVWIGQMVASIYYWRRP